MKVNDNIKEYWAKSGPKEVFGYDWHERKEMSKEESIARFDEKWPQCIEPALANGRVLDVEEALSLLPDDARRQYFRKDQEHIEVLVCGEKLIIQIDRSIPAVSQLWHLRPRTTAKGSDDSREVDLNSMADRANLPRKEVAVVIKMMGRAF